MPTGSLGVANKGSPIPRGGTFRFDDGLTTFTAGMDKRVAPGPFATAPIVQGAFDGSGVSDSLSYSRGTQVYRSFYGNHDGYQGSIIRWWTPEQSTGQRTGQAYLWYGGAGGYLKYNYDSNRFQAYLNSDVCTYVANVTAGVTYCIVFRWDSKRTLDGTNYMCISLNAVHSFGCASAPSALAYTNWYIGSSVTPGAPASGIHEGSFFIRRPLFDGTYGVPFTFDASGPVDEIAAIYAAGVGADPAQVLGGSWDICLAMPTDSSVGALV